MSLRVLPVNYFDDVEDLAVTPAAVTAFPITNLQSNVRGDVYRSPNLDQQTITGSFGGNSRRISAWGIFPALEGACLLGVRVRVRLYADAARATAAVYDSGTLDVFTWTGQGWGVFPWGSHPWGTEHGDRTARRTALVKYFTAVSVGSFEITITNSGAVDTPYFEVSRFWLADYVQAPYGAGEGAAPRWVPGSSQHRTRGGDMRRQSRPTWRAMEFETVFESEADRSAWSDLLFACNLDNEIVISLFPGDATPKKERDHTVMGSLVVLTPMVFASKALHRLQLAIEES